MPPTDAVLAAKTATTLDLIASERPHPGIDAPATRRAVPRRAAAEHPHPASTEDAIVPGIDAPSTRRAVPRRAAAEHPHPTSTEGVIVHGIDAPSTPRLDSL